jgi:hypothetical protein
MAPAIKPIPKRLYYQYQPVRGKNILISNIHVPRSVPLSPIPVAWGRGIADRTNLEAVDNSGNIFIKDGVYSPVPVEGATKIPKGSTLGMVIRYNETGEEIGNPQVVSLGKYQYLDRAEHVTNTIEITPSQKPGKLKVVETRMDTKGLRHDQSKFIYDISPEGARRIDAHIADPTWITDIRINNNKEADITYVLPDGSTQHLILTARYFKDNYGKALLAGTGKSKMQTHDDFYQSKHYTPETKRFRPTIDRFPARDGNYRLILHKAQTYEIKAPKGLPLEKDMKIYPSLAVAAAKVEGRWIPVTQENKVVNPPIIDIALSRVQAGEKQSALGPQTRTGGMAEMSLEYPRDANFYGGDWVARSAEDTLKYGANIAINRGKAIRANCGIESGRTHTMPWHLIYDELRGDIIETNSATGKLSNFGMQESGPGVSEDTQMELITRALGVKMHVVSEMVARLPAEKWWGKYNIQNAVRYIFSEDLFVKPFKFAVQDILSGRLFGIGKRPVFLKWGEISETAAGRTWYKWIFAKLTELAAVPFFLATLGHVLFFPVDLTVFILAWTARTVISSANYAIQLASLGYDGVKTGFWKNPAYELTFIPGYLRSAMRQFLDRNQFATFMLTVGGAGGAPPKKNSNWIKGIMAVQGSSIVAALGLIFYTGLAQLAWPIGLAIFANMIFGAYGFAVNWKALSIIKREGQSFKDHSKQNSLTDFENNHPEEYQQFTNIINQVALGRGVISYGALFAYRDQLLTILKKFDAVNNKGEIVLGWSNPYRDVLNYVVDFHTSAEMMICLKAIKEMKEGNEAAGRSNLRKLLKTTREFVIKDLAIKAARFHGLEL